MEQELEQEISNFVNGLNSQAFGILTQATRTREYKDKNNLAKQLVANMSDDLRNLVLPLILDGSYIDGVKLIRASTGCLLVVAKLTCDILKEETLKPYITWDSDGQVKLSSP